ncbi:MAG: hypothetical protein J3Q66DRAFT_42965 [Benniella sp.]|nr:MAG: hypothetical protein J3Q66DRAFT_42965 [Benniella sp.]
MRRMRTTLRTEWMTSLLVGLSLSLWTLTVPASLLLGGSGGMPGVLIQSLWLRWLDVKSHYPENRWLMGDSRARRREWAGGIQTGTAGESKEAGRVRVQMSKRTRATSKVNVDE